MLKVSQVKEVVLAVFTDDEAEEAHHSVPDK
jgi:hypothetical protein